MAAKKTPKDNEKAKDQPTKDIAKKQKKADELSDEQLGKVAGGRVFKATHDKREAHNENV